MSERRRDCPICGKGADAQARWFPFCSKRCRTLDLANWATGTYSIPSPATEADERLLPGNAPYESPSDG